MSRYRESEWMRSMRVRIDYNNMMAEHLGERGIRREQIKERMGEFAAAAERMEQKRGSMKWRELPKGQGAVVEEILESAKSVRERFDAFVVLGIGGSALGPLAVHQALRHLRYNELPREERGGPRLYIEDNVDPERMASLLDVIDVKRTMFNVISKSGSTSETMAQFLIVIKLLKEALGEEYADHVIVTTDANKGNLIPIAREAGMKTFFVPDGVGGRFSELCPVGLLCAAICGIDIEELLAGAAYMEEICGEKDVRKNPAYMMAALQVIAMESGHNISVMMPYADSLKYVADWYAQLWAESLGKKYDLDGRVVHRGQTPVKALGVTDQHSQVQLYTEGPFDKVITFLGVDRYRDEVEIPHGYEHIKDISFLCGHTLNELIQTEQAATEYALLRSGHINMRIVLPEVNAFTVGQFLYLLEMQTAFAGELLNVDAFDQPGVEEGKQAAYALLGKPGYEQKREQLQAMPQRDPRYRI
ncbi:MAG: glucose-6-phosphate isomerase [Bacillota bacterium]